MKFIYDHYLEILLSTGALAYVFIRFYEAYCELRARSFEDKVAEKMQKDFKKKAEKELKQTYSPEEISKFAEEVWDKYQPNLTGAVMGDKVLLKELVCEYCGTVELQENPRPAQWQSANRRYLLDKGMMRCTKCHAESSTVSGNSVKWKIVGNPDKKTIAQTAKEVIEDYNREANRMDFTFKFLMFGATWFAAGLSIYGLSFVPWTPILLSFWILIKNLTYALTRWYSLAGLAVTLFIFYRWHKQAIRDKIDYLRNVYSTRRRYRKMVQRKEEVTKDEVRSFVDSANGRLDEVVEKPNDQDRVEVSENEIPF